jgi:hypothetical protein
MAFSAKKVPVIKMTPKMTSTGQLFWKYVPGRA